MPEHRRLALIFVLTLAFLGLLVLISLVWGESVFPFTSIKDDFKAAGWIAEDAGSGLCLSGVGWMSLRLTKADASEGWRIWVTTDAAGQITKLTAVRFHFDQEGNATGDVLVEAEVHGFQIVILHEVPFDPLVHKSPCQFFLPEV